MRSALPTEVPPNFITISILCFNPAQFFFFGGAIAGGGIPTVMSFSLVIEAIIVEHPAPAGPDQASRLSSKEAFADAADSLSGAKAYPTRMSFFLYFRR